MSYPHVENLELPNKLMIYNLIGDSFFFNWFYMTWLTFHRDEGLAAGPFWMSYGPDAWWEGCHLCHPLPTIVHCHRPPMNRWECSSDTLVSIYWCPDYCSIYWHPRGEWCHRHCHWQTAVHSISRTSIWWRTRNVHVNGPPMSPTYANYLDRRWYDCPDGYVATPPSHCSESSV